MMKRKKTKIGLMVVALLLALGAGFFAGRSGTGGNVETANDEAAGSAEAQPIAPVKTMAVSEGEISEWFTAYGTVMVPANAHQSVVAPLEIRVEKILVVPGQRVKRGEAVVKTEPSGDTALALHQALATFNAAAQTLKNVQQRFAMKLATTQEQQAAETAAHTAGLNLANLQKRGAGTGQTLFAPQSGVVSRIDASSGQVVPAGGSLMTIDDQTQVNVRLGVDPSEAQKITVGEKVKTSLVGRTEMSAVTGTVFLITQQVNPQTRLVDVYATLPRNTAWMLDAPVTAQFAAASKHALTVPRKAVLPSGAQNVLFTVANGHAIKHRVWLGLQNDREVEILKAEPPLTAGDSVVIEGNYELEDGMKTQTVDKR